MVVYVGGLRARVVHESIYQEILDALVTLDWFNPARLHSPVQFLPTGVFDFDNVTVNTAALTSLDVLERDEEMGSMLAEHRWTFYVDFFAEDDAVGLHFIGDVKDIVGGRMPSIGRSVPHFPVYDYSQATPSFLFYVEVENVIVDRPTVYERPWQRFFRTVRFEIVDKYGTEDDA